MCVVVRQGVAEAATILRMGTLYLVRHGQASFGASNYDQLSELGAQQCHALGEYFAQRGVVFSAVLRGSLQRHVQSLQALSQGYGQHLAPLPVEAEWPGLNEYDSEALIRTVRTVDSGPLPKPDTPEVYRQYFRWLREAMQGWMTGTLAPVGMPSYVVWVAGINAALDHVRQQHTGNVLLVSSGGPIATAVGQVLGTAPETTIELNLRIKNSALTEFAFSPSRHQLSGFNAVPHLDTPERTSWVTHT
jgi:broad specificity phosphatase PhoE